jgi:two-component system NarL family sensor kinase
MRWLMFFLAMIIAVLTHAQRDSLLGIARSTNVDSTKVWALMEAGKLYLQSQPDSAVYFISQSLAAAEKTNFERGIAKCRINRAYAYNNLGRYKTSVADCQVAIPICRRLDMKKELVAAYNNMGNAWDFQGNRWQAIDAFSDALQAMEGANLPPNFPIVVRNNLARQYENLGLYQKSFDYGKQSYKEAVAMGDSALVASGLHIMAFAALSLGREAEALGYCRRVARIAREVEDPVLLVFALNNIAVMSYWEQPATAGKMMQEALTVAQGSGDLFGEIAALQGLARFSIWSRRFSQAEQYANNALEKAQQENMNDEVAACYLLLSDIALATGKTKSHFDLRRHFFYMSDTLTNNQLVHATQELETKYETAQKEQQIVSLQQEKELQQLRLRQKNGLIGGLTGAAVLMVVLAALAWINLQNRRKIFNQETRIQAQKIKELEQERQLSIADAVMQGQEKERSRLARDLHDGLGGMLSGIKQTLFAMKGNQILPETSAAALGLVVNDLDRSINELRHIARNMMPEALVRFGLNDALEDFCDHLQQSGELKIHFQSFGMEERLPQETEVVLFRIAQELLNNVVRHAQASNALVQLLRDKDRLSLTVEDDGKGFDATALSQVQGIGWVNIRSRVNYLGGELDVRSAPGEGCSVHIEMQLP